MVKIDPYNTRQQYLNWKAKVITGIPEISAQNASVLMNYLKNMEQGLNVSSQNRKGSRSYTRLNTIRTRMLFLMKSFELRFNLENITTVQEEQLHAFFLEMRSGIIKRHDGSVYKSTKDYVQDFKAFWHWWQKVNKKQNIDIKDITVDLDTRGDKPKWVYLTEEQIKLLAESAKYKYRVLIWFLFDTGIRAPTELLNIKVSDFFNNYKELNIRDEASKTFGRRIKVMLCSDLIKEYIEQQKLNSFDYLFNFNPTVTNRYLKRLAEKLFGDKESPAGEKYSALTMYDFRHCACCYWLPRYKSESALKYRFGWKKSDKIHYYSELLGMRDTISEEDMLIDITKTEIEKRLQRAEKEKEILQDEIKDLRLQVIRIGQLTNQLWMKTKEQIQII